MMNRFTIYRGNPDTRSSRALEFCNNSHAVRFSVSKSIAITGLGFYKPAVFGNTTALPNNMQPRFVRVLLVIQESPTLNDDMAVRRQPSQYLDQTAYEINLDEQLSEFVFKFNLETAVLIPKNTVIEIYFNLMVLGHPAARFLRLPDDHPIVSLKVEHESQAEFSFLSSSKQLASIDFALLHEVWGSGACFLEDGRTIYYKRELQALENGVYLEDEQEVFGEGSGKRRNDGVELNQVEVKKVTEENFDEDIDVESSVLQNVQNFLGVRLCTIL